MAQIIEFTEAKKKLQDNELVDLSTNRCNNILKNLQRERKDFNTELIKKTAEDILKELDFYNKRIATPIVKIANNFDIKSYKEKIEKGDIKGYLYINGTTNEIYGQDKVIIVKKGNSLFFNRFTVARELGAFLFNYKEKGEYKDKEKVFIDTYSTEHCEDYERFAFEILMPREMFIMQYNIAVEEGNGRYMFVIMYLSRFFEVPEYFVENRINQILYY